MYKLISGDKDNTKHLYLLETTTELRPIIKRHHTIYNVQASIFSNNFDESEYDDLVTALTIGDELNVPISYEEAKVLFFALNVNMSNYNSRIRSISKAYIFFNDFEGNYSKVTFVDTKNAVIQLIKIPYIEIIPGVSIEFKIPFYVVSHTNEYHFTIAECNTYTMVVNNELYQITRNSMNKLLNGNYSNIFKHHEDILDTIDTNINILFNCLLDAEFIYKEIEFPFDSSTCLEFTDDNILIAWDSIRENSEDWIQKDVTKYILNEYYTNIVPINPTANKMSIYIYK